MEPINLSEVFKLNDLLDIQYALTDDVQKSTYITVLGIHTSLYNGTTQYTNYLREQRAQKWGRRQKANLKEEKCW